MNKEKFTRAGLEPVGRAPARQSGGRRFKSRSSKYFFVHPNLSKICTQSVCLVVYYMIKIIKIQLVCHDENKDCLEFENMKIN